MTDEEKRDLQKQLDQAKNEMEHWRQNCLKWKQMYDKILLSDKSITDETVPDEAVQENKTISYNTFDRLRKRFTDIIEKMVYIEGKYEKERKSLIEKIEEQQKELTHLRGQIDDEIGPPRGLKSPNHDGNCVQELSTEEMDLETAVEEVKSLRKLVSIRDEHISNLKMQIRSFPEAAMKSHAIQKHGRDELQWKTEVNTS